MCSLSQSYPQPCRSTLIFLFVCRVDSISCFALFLQTTTTSSSVLISLLCSIPFPPGRSASCIPCPALPLSCWFHSSSDSATGESSCFHLHPARIYRRERFQRALVAGLPFLVPALELLAERSAKPPKFSKAFRPSQRLSSTFSPPLYSTAHSSTLLYCTIHSPLLYTTLPTILP
eukprot:768563-Hanusia_phi.AAC.5